MKKLLLLVVSCIFAISVFAQSRKTTDSCNIEGVPGAYVTAELVRTPGHGSWTTKVILRSYGVKDAAVTVEVKGETCPANSNNIPFTDEKMGYIENGKGEVIISRSNNVYVESIKIYSAVCQ